jgi:hypothetical protein
MKKYFFSDGSIKDGPLTINELINKDLKPDSLIWYEGLENWIAADKVLELREVFELRPPPLEKLGIDNPTSDTPELVQGMPSIKYFNKSKSNAVTGIFSFDGRIGRAAFCFSIIYFIIGVVFVYFVAIGLDTVVLGALFTPLLWYYCAQRSKRCHDLGLSGWFQLVPLCTYLLLFKKGQAYTNKYGGISAD